MMPQKAIRKPFEKFKVVKLPSALSKREARRLPSATTVMKAAIDRTKDVLHARLHAGTAEQWVIWQEQKPALANYYPVKAPDLATDLNLVIATAIVGDTGERGKAAVAVVGTRMVTTEASMQFNWFKVKTRVSPRSHTMQSVGALEQVSAHATVELQLPNRRVYDTGAEGNILSLRTYRRMFPRNLNASGYPKSTEVTHRPEVTLTAYNGGEIKQHGTISLRCRYKNSGWHTLNLYIAESEGPAILGLASCKLMNIVTAIVTAVNRSAECMSNKIRNIEDLKNAFPQSFDTVRSFKEEYHLTVDPAVAPVVHPCRKYAIQRREAIQNELKKMEAMGVIVKETEPTDWVSSLTFTKKGDGTLRLCLDPKDLNRALKRPHHKTPTLEEITHHFSGAKFFSKLDAKNGYWSIRLDEPSSKLTTFKTPFGRFRFLRLPFGLVLSQEVFQQHMDAILEKCPGCTGIADDVAVYGRTEEEHDDNFMKVAQENGLVFNSGKCITYEIPFFRLMYTADGVKPDPDRVDAIRALSTPKSVQELQEFLGIATYMVSFVPTRRQARLSNTAGREGKLGAIQPRPRQATA